MNGAEIIRPTWTTGLTNVLNTGTWRNAFPIYKNRRSPCTNNCPLNNQTPAWMQLLKDKQYHQAWLAIVEQNPFPAITGRICHHPCEKACNRKNYDEEVAIQNIERFLGDLALQEGWSLPIHTHGVTGKIAVVGGGPAGLAASYFLKRLGYHVTIFEKRAKLGGLLQYGIPQYRLPKEILDQEIARLLKIGIEVRTNTYVGPEKLALMEEEYDSVFLALGAQKPKMLPQIRELNFHVNQGLEFLEEVNQGKIPELGSEIVVIGGGSAAMDVARSARRLGKEVKIIAVEDKASLPAQAQEIEEALAEGIIIFDGSMVEEVVITDRKQLQLTCVKVILEQNTPQGIIKPTKIPDTTFELLTDNILLAIGQVPDISGLPVETLDDCVKIDNNYRTSREKIYAGGDLASLERFVSIAISQGKAAAQSIANNLSNALWQNLDDEEVVFNEINTFYFPRKGKLINDILQVEARMENFTEFVLTASLEQALDEAERCFNCGYCIECNNCYHYCPDMAIEKNVHEQIVKYQVLEQYCKGCGLCVKECPRGVLLLKEEQR